MISVDSHDYLTDGNYDYIHDNQVSWYTDVINNDKKLFGEDVQSFVYTHIPLMEYNDAWYAYQGGDTRAEYISGTKREDVCCSSVRGRMGTAMSQLNSTQAVFCGHDHLNDYIIKYCGVTYAYSKSIDYSAYEGIENLTEQRGATLLTLDYNGIDYTTRSILLTDIQDDNNSGDNTGNDISDDIINNTTQPDTNLFVGTDGVWRYYNDGVADTTYTGMALNQYGWWYVTNGVLDLSYTGMASNEYGWWYMTNGVLDLSYTGMASNEYGWWYMTNGVLDLTYTGMALNMYGWWYMTDGVLDLSYTGMALNEYGWWYMTNGVLDLDYTGIAQNTYGWWYMQAGVVDYNYDGIVDNKYGEWSINNGYASLVSK